jgi:hypothetical protein
MLSCGLTLGVCFIVRRLLNGIAAPSRASSPAARRPMITPDQLLQQQTRIRTAEGKEAVHATLVAEFPVGQRSATLYLAFCPPFEYLPDIEASVTDGPEANVEVTQLLHNGAQLDVHLSDNHQTHQHVVVEVLAAEPAA